LTPQKSQKIPPDVYVRLSFEGEATKETQIYKLRVQDNAAASSQDSFLPRSVKFCMVQNTSLNRQEALSV
jgi:hypothetical protein